MDEQLSNYSKTEISISDTANLVPHASIQMTLSTCTVLSNGLVLLTIISLGRFNTPAWFCILNLAFSDLLIGIAGVIESICSIFSQACLDNVIFCMTKFFAAIFSMTAETTGVLLVTVERFYLTVYPLKYERSFCLKRTLLMGIGGWLFNVAFSVALVIIFKLPWGDEKPCFVQFRFGPLYVYIQLAYHGLAGFVVSGLYAKVLFTVLRTRWPIGLVERLGVVGEHQTMGMKPASRNEQGSVDEKAKPSDNKEVPMNGNNSGFDDVVKHDKHLMERPDRSVVPHVRFTIDEDNGPQATGQPLKEVRNPPQRPAEKSIEKLTQVLAIIIASFLLCWLSFSVVFCLVVKFPSNELIISVQKIVVCLLLTHSIINPIVYSLRLHDFAKAAKDVLCLKIQRKILCQILTGEEG